MSIKEKFVQIKEKVVNFAQEHPKITGALIFMGLVTGCAVTSAIRSEHELSLEDYAHIEEQEWKKYEENWNKVNEFAETLKLLPGESFIIEDPEQFRDCTDFSQCDFSKPIVSHLVYNEGVYPPEE